MFLVLSIITQQVGAIFILRSLCVCVCLVPCVCVCVHRDAICSEALYSQRGHWFSSFSFFFFVCCCVYSPCVQLAVSKSICCLSFFFLRLQLFVCHLGAVCHFPLAPLVRLLCPMVCVCVCVRRSMSTALRESHTICHSSP